MERKCRGIYLLALAVLLSAGLQAQQFVSVLKKLNAEYRQEKLYLHFDRAYYNPGETIWFKAYLFSGNFPSLVSNTLYVELLDAKGKPLRQVSLPVILSGAAGSLEIPADAGGTVLVRAYTKWMLNFDSSFLFTKALSVITPRKPGDKTAVTAPVKNNPGKATPATLHFFPEGGDLIEEVASRIAFKATAPDGMPVEVTGDVLDSKGVKIASFASIHDGMGTFTFQPRKGEQYKAVWQEQGHAHETMLPSAKQYGIVLEADNEGNKINFKIKHAVKVPGCPFVYVVAQMHQQLVYRAKAFIDTTLSASGSIPIEDVPTGILQLTVFTPDEQPLAERIVFANSSGYSFTAGLDASVMDAGKRGKNTLVIEVPDTVPCNLSVAVTDADLNPGQKQDNIYSGILLTSDIKGYVHNPAYYFSGDADSVARHLDLVMLTNGWRRFKWKEVLAGQFPVLHYPPGDYISVEGQIGGINNKLLAGKELTGVMQYNNKGKEFINIPVQQDGKFSFSGMIFYDTAKLFYQFNNDKKKTLTSRARFDIKTDLLQGPLRLQPDYSLLPDVAPADTAMLAKNTDVIHYRQLSEDEFKKAKTLKTVTVTSVKKTKKQLMDEEYTSGLFNDPSHATRIILPEDDPAFLASPSLLNYLQGRIAGLQVSPDSTENAVRWRGQVTALFVNEISQQTLSFAKPGAIAEDASYVLSLPMSEIAMVKIFEPPFFGGWGGGPGGAIAVYLKKPGDREPEKNNDFTMLGGYSPVREFYSPDYSTPVLADVPDYRPTLYWNPFVVMGKKDRKIYLSFYNNDITKNIRVIIEGCDEDGKLTRVEKIITSAAIPASHITP